MLLVALSLLASMAPSTAIPAAPAQAIPLSTARLVLEEARLASAEDGGRLWGRELCGPMLLVDPQSRFAVANQSDGHGGLAPADGVFVGTLPTGVVVANTATEWNGQRWTMVMWPSIGESAVARRRLLLHECWHRVQADLGLAPSEGDNGHLDALDGRYWLLLELRALAAALRASADGRSRAIADALLFRGERRRIVAGAAVNERRLENNEGLAEYTGFALRGTGGEETRLAVARRLDMVDVEGSFVRSFAYQTGPAYGLLLDALASPAAPSWRSKVRLSDDLGELLRTAAGLPADTPSQVGARAAAYAGSELRTAEEARDRGRRERLARLHAELVDGPVLEIPMNEANYSFDPNGVVPLAGAGTVYVPFEASGAWGTLSAANGALVAEDRSRARVPAPPDASRPLMGKGWALTLNPGWRIVPGARAGDLRLEKESG